MKSLRMLILLLLTGVIAVSTIPASTAAQDEDQDEAPVEAPDPAARLLSDPFLQLPTADSVRVVWFTEFAGQEHTLTYGEELDQTAEATTTQMSRMAEDASSAQQGASYDEVTEREVWRHEAIATDLTPGERVPYFVTSLNDDGDEISSDEFTLQPLPEAGQPMQILLTSDQQNRQMSPANFQKLIETVGRVDAVFFAGDFVDTPHRASEWFDRYAPEWLNDNNPAADDFDPARPAFPSARPAFFPALQGNYQDLFPEFPYSGGEVLQHAPLFGSIGNHESPGRWQPNATVTINGDEFPANLNWMDNDPQPRWYAEMRYDQLAAADPDFAADNDREEWVRDNSFEHTQYFEMWTHPEGPIGENYYAYQIGDVFVVSMNVSRVWRTWSNTDNDRGKFTEITNELANPENWGFGDMWFETYNEGSDQYEWLEDVVASEEFQNAEYRVVLAHQTMFGLGDNALPVMADRVMNIEYLDGENLARKSFTLPLTPEQWADEIEPILDDIQSIRYEYPLEEDVWKNDIEPLLLANNVDMVHVGHSHVWNRARVGDMHYLETSNVGNTFGAYFGDAEGVVARRASWAGAFWNGLTEPDSPWDFRDYPSFNDPHNRLPIYPTIFNPMREMDGAARDVPYVASNNITVFSVLDTGTGTVSSYAFDVRDPDSEVRKFDEFALADDPFRVQPYQQNPTSEGITLTWFTEEELTGSVEVSGGDLDAAETYTTTPELMTELEYSELEIEQFDQFPDMYDNSNYKHSLTITGLTAGTTYDYAVTVGDVTLSATFQTAPNADTSEPIRFIVMADSETDPDGRTTRRVWGDSAAAPAAQDSGSAGRPGSIPQARGGSDFYLATKQQGYTQNLAIVKQREPDFLVMPGDLVRGGGYQRAWDEFFRHNAGEFDNPLSYFPLLPALGHWENTGARNGGYEPGAVQAARQKYTAYFDNSPNNNPDHQDLYYRIDYGPVTIITLDSSNGLPDGQREVRDGLSPSNFDTQENIIERDYPGNDLVDFNEGSEQWLWAEAQMEEASEQGQIIFVQFHHAPYSSGRHGYTMFDANSSGQDGTPMREYAPLFERYGVVAVFSGHSELFERSTVNGIHYYDVGVAGDNLGGPEPPQFAEANNPFSQWMAHYDKGEFWEGNRLIRGGKHYGHLEVNVTPNGNGSYSVTMTPAYAFPLNENFVVTGWERREYYDEVTVEIEGAAAPEE